MKHYLEIDDLLPIVEAAKFMDFVEVKEGDISLKPIAREFIQGNIDERKYIFRKQLLENVRLVQQIYNLLKAKHNRRIPEELVLDLLENHFSTGEAQRQLDTAIHWGRYAELYGFDEPAGEIFLEEAEMAGARVGEEAR